MTNEEAKANLEKLLLLYDDGMIDFHVIRESVKTAIEALQDSPAQMSGTSDLISRRAVELALIEKGQASKRYKLGEFWELNGEEIREALASVPSAQPEWKKGTWTPAFNGKFTGGAYWFNCSECGRIVPEVRNGGWNFCPNCGADMRGEPDE